jgi:hypothetical protein
MVYYLTYDEYSEMGGTLDETLFDTLVLDAQGYIDWYTFNRLWKEEWRTEDVMERVKICMYQLISLVAAKQNLITPQGTNAGGINVNAQVSTQSNDGVSTTYAVLSGELLFSHAKKEIEDTINRYLNGIVNSVGRKLLYRGLYPGE